MAQRFDIGSGNPASSPVFIGTDITLQFSMTTATNVSGWTVVLTFKKNASDNTPIKQYSTATGGLSITDGANGVWSAPMSRADTLLFAPPGTYVYDLERTDNGSATVLSYGFFQTDRKVNS